MDTILVILALCVAVWALRLNGKIYAEYEAKKDKEANPSTSKEQL